jgi:hypothetical protein
LIAPVFLSGGVFKIIYYFPAQYPLLKSREYQYLKEWKSLCAEFFVNPQKAFNYMQRHKRYSEFHGSKDQKLKIDIEIQNMIRNRVIVETPYSELK